MTLIADEISKLWTPKNMVKQIPKKSPFGGPFRKKYLRLTKQFCDLNGTIFPIFIDKFEGNWVRKLDNNYPPLNTDNLRQPIQMHLSEKQKIFSQFLSAFLKARLYLDIFNEKVTLIADVFVKLRTPKCLMK